MPPPAITTFIGGWPLLENAGGCVPAGAADAARQDWLARRAAAAECCDRPAACRAAAGEVPPMAALKVSDCGCACAPLV